MSAFDKALDHVLRFEGGFVDHPLDPGGATNHGVTQATYDAWRRAQGQEPRSVREIERAEVRSIYWGRYWLKVGAHQLPPALAFVVFDAAVNHGVGRALSWLAETHDWRVLVAHRLNFYSNLSTWDAFGKGWTRRMASVTRLAAELDGDTPETRQVLVFDESGAQAAHVSTSGDVLIRVRGSRVYVRPDK